MGWHGLARLTMVGTVNCMHLCDFEVWFVVHRCPNMSYHCLTCNGWFDKLHQCKQHGELRCDDCRRKGRHQDSSLPSPSPSSPSSSNHLQRQHDRKTHRLSNYERARILVYLSDKKFKTQLEAANQLHTTPKSIRRWSNKNKIQLIVKEKERSGRKRKLDAVTVARIVKEAQDTVFTTPKRIKRGTHL